SLACAAPPRSHSIPPRRASDLMTLRSPAVVDAQLHLNLFGIEPALAAMDAVGVDAVVVDEFWGFDEDRNPIPGHRLPNGSYRPIDRKSTRLNSSHQIISYAVFG